MMTALGAVVKGPAWLSSAALGAPPLLPRESRVGVGRGVAASQAFQPPPGPGGGSLATRPSKRARRPGVPLPAPRQPPTI